MRFRLKTRYTLILLSLIAAAVAIVSGILLFEFKSSSRRLTDTSADVMEVALRGEVRERGAALSEQLAEIIFNPLHDFDMESMGLLLRTISSRRDVDQALVVDDQLRVVHDGTDYVTTFGDPADSRSLRAALDSGRLAVEDTDEHVRFAMPVSSGGYTIGAVQIAIASEPTMRSVASARARLDAIAEANFSRNVSAVAWVTIALTLSGVVVASLLSRSLTRPIDKLAVYATQVGHGSIPDELELERGDEIGDLARAFDEMGGNLRRTTEEIRHMAYHDSLTGLPNRLMFREFLAQAVASARRRGHLAALMFLDLDHFKRINDTLGHEAGDSLLKAVAARLVDSLRDEDVVTGRARYDEEDKVARLGGDEFTVLLPRIDDPLHAALVARRLLAALSEPFELEGREVVVRVSIGITIFPSDADDADDLLRNADMALYHAKDEGRNNYQYFVESMNASAVSKLELEDELRRALVNDEFELHYQPQIEALTGRPLGAEALIRWRHPTRGMVSPGEFIPVAEETGLIVDVGTWVLRRACLEAAGWHRAGLTDLHVAVNVSTLQLRRADFPGVVEAALAESGLAAPCLHVEVTESTLMDDETAAHEVMAALDSLGVELWLDDFGTGYSSLSYLRRFPMSGLKIDWSFVRDIANDPEDLAITRAIVAMAASLRLAVTAEGVETEEQVRLLRELRCGRFQGFLFGRPMPAHEVQRRLTSAPPLTHLKTALSD